MPLNPIIPRRRLGIELRRLREKAGISADQAAEALECSQSKISRLETGKAVPKVRDVRDLLNLYGNPGPLREEELLQLARDSQDTRAWWNSFRDVAQEDFLPDHLLRFVAFEQSAASVSAYSPLLISGLVQSPGYIHAITGEFYSTSSERDRSRFIEFRQQRQKVLQREDPQSFKFDLIMCESVLMRSVASDSLMIEQLQHLISLASNPELHVRIRIVPLKAGLHRGLIGPFSILRFADPDDQNIVYIEGAEGAVYLETMEGVSRYEETFRAIEEKALDADQTISHIQALVDSLLADGGP